ncbi:MAG TPA: branched-chain amino acid ABC transporter permease [Solirubrobacteraceae bacterium]|jgi:branched-subunit amino acid ABC-type transport system permease component|nr:branched-chain amino acid ABC transporter permease [Solirubrobacteraceae bacterium]
MSQFLHAVGFGLATASIVALAAVAVNLQVSVTNFFNFAYGDFMSFGAYVAWAANSGGLNFYLSVALGGVAVGVLGMVANFLVFRPFMRRGVRPVTLLIAGVGLSFVVQNALILIWTPVPRRFSIDLGNARHIGPFLLTPGDLVMIGASVALLLLLHLGLTYTKAGKAIRATSNNIDLAQSCGINSDRVISLTWFLAGLFTAVAGVGLVLQESTLSPTTGFTELFVIFGAVILGGIGRPYGAMLGALIVGLLTEVAGAYVNGAYKTSIAFAVVILLLLFRPQGLIKARGLMR